MKKTFVYPSVQTKQLFLRDILTVSISEVPSTSETSVIETTASESTIFDNETEIGN